MLTIPFLTKAVKARSKSGKTAISPDLPETIAQAISALKENNPSRALSLVAPWHPHEESPDEIKLIAGKALCGLGRYPEAMECFEEFLASRPESVEGLLSAGLTAARARRLAQASDLFNRASLALTGRARDFFEPLTGRKTYDPVAIEELVVAVDSFPEDCDRLIALVCALGCAGHFRAVERFLPGIRNFLQ